MIPKKPNALIFVSVLLLLDGVDGDDSGSDDNGGCSSDEGGNCGGGDCVDGEGCFRGGSRDCCGLFQQVQS